jgi:hypothetical protein
MAENPTPRKAANALPPLTLQQRSGHGRKAQLNWQVLAARRRAEHSFRLRQATDVVTEEEGGGGGGGGAGDVEEEGEHAIDIVPRHG